MADMNNTSISDELLASYLDGNTTAEETMRVLSALKSDDKLQEILITSERVDNMLGNNMSDNIILPMDRLAAERSDSLCDFLCELYILKKMNITFSTDELSDEAIDNHWLKDKGTPLHNIGRLLETNNLSVVRKYESSIENICQACQEKANVIVVINLSALTNENTNAKDIEQLKYHAVVVLRCDESRNEIIIYDPATELNEVHYGIDQFLLAWKYSRCYMVVAKEKKLNPVYNPQPVNSDDVDLTEDITELREAIAENAHDVWASARIKEGWTYGAVRNDALKQNPDIVPYDDLPDSEKQYDRDLAMQTIKLMKKLGYEFVRKDSSELYKSLLNKIKNVSEKKVYYCVDCGAPIYIGQIYCERCGRRIGWKELIG